MDTVSISNLVVEGVHGVTEKEKKGPQRFKIDVVLKTSRKQYIRGSIEHALDYRAVKKIIVEVVRNTSFPLIETIAHTIALNILEKTIALSATVTISKIDIWGNGYPSVSITKEKVPSHIDLLDFDIEETVENICIDGGASIPIIPEFRRVELLEEAYSHTYNPQPEVLSGGLVREQLSSVTDFPADSLFHQLRNDFTELLIRKLGTLTTKDIFSTPLRLDELSLQKYEAGSIGITPHKDGKSRLNLICVFILAGTSEFAICEDRGGNNPKFLSTSPGNVILLRGPGFFHSTFQPFHFVRNITEQRIVFGLRQNGRN
ncbi:MAG: dihydroneopterin aldolase [Patescibacteria group bacterium]